MIDTARTFTSQVPKERQNKTAEIFTPPELVEQMLDRFPPEAWTTPDKKWLEPSCGDGNFLIAILNRLMVGLETAIPDVTARHQHIIENMLYGVDIMPDNVAATIERLNATGLKHNIVCSDALAYDYKFNSEPPLFDWPAK